eukprot:2774845-Rhodomonas_salina.1
MSRDRGYGCLPKPVLPWVFPRPRASASRGLRYCSLDLKQGVWVSSAQGVWVASPGKGVASPGKGVASPEMGVASPEMGVA